MRELGEEAKVVLGGEDDDDRHLVVDLQSHLGSLQDGLL